MTFFLRLTLLVGDKVGVFVGSLDGTAVGTGAVWPVTGSFVGGEVCGAAPPSPGTGGSESSDDIFTPPVFPSKLFEDSTTAKTATPTASRVTAIMADTKPFR